MLQEWDNENTVSVTLSLFLIECGIVRTVFLFNCK